MRFLPRLLHTGAAATILVILYCLWMQQDGLEHQLHEAWHGTAHRVVVFGDDWSDTGRYRVPLPTTTQGAVVRDQSRGAVWTETLCEELGCDFIDNYARSGDGAVGGGPVVDSDLFAQAVTGRDMDMDGGVSLSLLPDFKTQVRQFVQYEQGKRRVLSSRLRAVDEWTVFCVAFGLWDVFAYGALEQRAGMRAVDGSVAALFEGLDEVARHVDVNTKSRGKTGRKMTVVLPLVVDVTMLPRFQARRKDILHEQRFAEEQHKLVFLSTYWNTAVARAAAQWEKEEKGHVVMPDPNRVIVDQARASQLDQHRYRGHDTHDAQHQHQQPLFDHIARPCLTSPDNLNAANMAKCVDADRHLFWDDVHPSAPAHALMAKAAVASLLRANDTLARQHPAFTLKLPPGY